MTRFRRIRPEQQIVRDSELLKSVEKCDVAVAGCGLGGLTAAAAFGTAGFRVCCFDVRPAGARAEAVQDDGRTTAVFDQAQILLGSVGAWDALEPVSAPLRTMRIVSAADSDGGRIVEREFHAEDWSKSAFGWCVPNARLVSALWEKIEELPNVEIRLGAGFGSAIARSTSALVELTDGTRLSAKLLIAADGRNSKVRDGAGIRVRRHGFAQKALAFNVVHEVPHGDASTEIHSSGGPFTLVPLPDAGGRPASAVVWMARGEECRALAGMPESEFEAAAYERSFGYCGKLELASERKLWPMQSQLAERLAAERTALIAEAAHVVPPVGAQGYNMAAGDVGALMAAIGGGREKVGSAGHLERYQRLRRSDIALRVAAISALNEISIGASAAVRRMRSAALDAVHKIRPAGRVLVSAALGPVYLGKGEASPLLPAAASGGADPTGG